MATPAPVHVYQIYVRASADRVWQAITDPEFTKRYFYRSAFESTFEPGASYRMVLPDGDDAVVGTIEEVDPPRKLVMTWRVLYDTVAAEEPPSRVEWHLLEGADGVTKVTTIHRDLGLSPVTSSSVAAGWNWVLQSMKTLVETGEPLPGSAPSDDVASEAANTSIEDAAAEAHRKAGIDANNSAWELLGRDDLTPEEIDDLLGRVYAAAYHWRRAARRGPENAARASWLISRAHAVLGQGELALHHADQCLAATTAADLHDFDLAYAHEARARALACLDRFDEAAVELKAAHAVPIADDEDRSILVVDLASEPWYGLAI
jgi:uncharacterized protein YndB with AHSA1/START domain